MHPNRQIRAVFDRATITVYQAYSADIALPAVASGSLAETPFKLSRMTWIKPSFLWMMYRSGWATKPGQEHVLAIQMSRAGFEQALSLACLSHFAADIYPTQAAWEERKRTSPVRVQWDPERNLALERQQWRSLQLGLSGEVLKHYVSDWILNITDITDIARHIQRLVVSGETDAAAVQIPDERPYPLSNQLRAITGAA